MEAQYSNSNWGTQKLLKLLIKSKSLQAKLDSNTGTTGSSAGGQQFLLKPAFTQMKLMNAYTHAQTYISLARTLQRHTVWGQQHDNAEKQASIV